MDSPHTQTIEHKSCIQMLIRDIHKQLQICQFIPIRGGTFFWCYTQNITKDLIHYHNFIDDGDSRP